MSEAATGRRILGEIEETSLDEILTTFRTSLYSTSPSALYHAHTHNNSHPALPSPSLSNVKSYPFPILDTLVARHFRATQSAPLSLSGAHLPLIYKLVATLVTSPQNKTVVIIDMDAKFDITRVLQCTPCAPVSTLHHTAPEYDTAGPAPNGKDEMAVPNLGPRRKSITVGNGQRVAAEDLRHIHVYRPARGSPSHIRDVLTAAEQFIIYSKHASLVREWWGTIVIGGGSPTVLGTGHADVTTGWKGWLRVDREEVRGFPLGMSAEEALVDRDQRQRAADASGYMATCAWGGFNFREAGGE